MSRWVKITAAIVVTAAFAVVPAQAQITTPRKLSASPDRFANLQEQLINRLRATTEDKQAYIRRLVALVRSKKLDVKLVVAIDARPCSRGPPFRSPTLNRRSRLKRPNET